MLIASAPPLAFPGTHAFAAFRFLYVLPDVERGQYCCYFAGRGQLFEGVLKYEWKGSFKPMTPRFD